MATSRLYYDPAGVSAFSTLNKLLQKKNINLGKMRARLEKQDSYTLHRPVKKRFARNPYTLNVMDVWECDLVDVRALGKYNDK